MRKLLSALSAKYKKLFPSKAPVIIILSVLAAIVSIIAFAAFSTSSDSATATPKDQVASIVSSSVSFRDITDPINSQLPVTIVSSTEYLDMLSTTESTVTEAVVNPALGMTAAVFTDSAGTATIYATRLLSEQYEALLAAYEQADADVTVTAAGARTITTPTGRTQTISPNGEVISSGPNFFLIFGILFILLTVFIFWRRRMFMKQNESMGGGGGRHQTEMGKKEIADIPETRFSDVAGCEEAVDELKEVVHYLKEPEKFASMGARAAKGVLLSGPPGTGKTLLARAVAGEAGVPFYSVSGSDFVEMFVGVGPKRVRELFSQAKKHTEGCIIFIDEIDAAGRKRGSSGSNSNQEHESTLNALLIEIDGFEKNKIIVMGATNRPDILDEALTRPGRLEKKVTVGLPDRNGRIKILEVHSVGKPLDESVDFSLISRRTPGMSGAELAQLVNEACLEAVRADRTAVTEADFDSAIAIVTMGRARTSAIISDEDKRLTAWHEAGHAVCGLVQEDAESPVSISIIPRGPAGGVTHFPASDSGYITRKQAYARLVTGMGGMAAEQMLIGGGEFTTGPSGDLQQCTNTALAMVTQYGMGESLLVKSEALLGAAGDGADDALREADMLMRHALEEAKKLLVDNLTLFHNMVEALLEYETLMQSDIEALVANRSVVPSAVAPPAPRSTPAKPLVVKEAVEVVPSQGKRTRKLGELVSVARESLAGRKRKKALPYG